MIIPLSVKNQSIETSGITSDYKEALCEFIWNGLEANATEIDMNYRSNTAFGIGELSIEDNGDGINYEELKDTFGAFLTSRKNLISLKMKSKANKGKGRFSFSSFSNIAKWTTAYKCGTTLKKRMPQMLLIGTRVRKGRKKAVLIKMGKVAPAIPTRLTVRLKN